MVRHTLPMILFALCTLSSCTTTPLSRSYDDPYNSPLPNETAPPSLSSQQEQCTRDPIGCEAYTSMCQKDKDCEKDEVCSRNVCTIEESPGTP